MQDSLLNISHPIKEKRILTFGVVVRLVYKEC